MKRKGKRSSGDSGGPAVLLEAPAMVQEVMRGWELLVRHQKQKKVLLLLH